MSGGLLRDPVDRAEVWLIRLPMRWPLMIGPITYQTRDYVVLRLTTKQGAQGAAVGYTRGIPLLEAVGVLLSDLSALEGDPHEVQQRLRMRFATGWGALVRAASLIDIALWDIRARSASKPLAATLGDCRNEVDLMVVAGYFADRRDRVEVLDEIEQFVSDGFTTIKLIVSGGDARADLDYVAQVQQRVGAGVDVAIDLHGAYLTAASAREYVRAMSDSGVRFLEDPLPSIEVDELAALIRSTDLPIAAGEDLIASSSYRSLVRIGVRALRVDTSATGGYTGVQEGLAAAQQANVDVFPHVWPYLHAPLAAASPLVRAVEVIPDYVKADPIMAYMTEPLPIRDGKWVLSSTPGLHLPLDWARLTATADDYRLFSADSPFASPARPVRARQPSMLITGAASGLGAALAALWVSRGGLAIMVDRDEAQLLEAVGTLQSTSPSGTCAGLIADVGDHAAVTAAAKRASDLVDGRLDCLVNCAGIARPAAAAEVELERWAELVDIHLTGTMRVCQSCYPLLKANGSASIVNISSVAATLGMPGRSSYAAAKAGVEGLTRTLAVEWAPDGIRVNAVAPGYIDSHMTAGLVAEGHLRLEPILARTPLHRLVAPSEIAAAVLFLASPDAAYITGQVLRVDGGMTVEGDWYS
ncbi:MAG: SDR family oxidoreductase [Chloroflexi bacterium]|nr:SDR family oxidoreductase [Chloroflexota bacterium]